MPNGIKVDFLKIGSGKLTVTGQVAYINDLPIGGGNFSGYITSGSADLRYYPLESNPSGYLVNFNLTGASGALQSQVSNLENQANLYYLKSNPSGYITGFSSGNYITTGQTGQFTALAVTTGLSGYLVGLIGSSAAGVGNLNGLSGLVNLVGTGNVFVTVNGQNIIVSGSGASANFSGYITTGQADLRYYPLQANPSGYLVNFNLTGASGALQSQLADLSGATGLFYLNSNPSGFIANLNLTNASGVLQGQINSLSGATGLFYLNSNPSGFLNYLAISGSGIDLARELLLISGDVTTVDWSGRRLSGDWTLNNSHILTGIIAGTNVTVTNNNNGTFTVNSTGGGVSALELSGASGVLQTQITNLNNGTGLFYLNSNPSGFITNFNLTGASGRLQLQINGLSGATGLFYLNSNPSGFITNFNLTGASGALAQQIGASSAGVATLNGLSGTVVLQGTGNISLSTNGQILYISGSGEYFPPNSLAYQTFDNVNLDGGSIDGVVIGATVQSAGSFSTLDSAGYTALAYGGGEVAIGTAAVRGKLHVKGADLGEFLGDQIVILALTNLNDNDNVLEFQQIRHTSGLGWANATTRIQQITDVTPQGYIDFNPIGNPGLAFGTNGNESVRIVDNGFVGIGTIAPAVSLEINRDGGAPDSFAAIRLTDAYGGVESWDLRTNNELPSASAQVGVFSIYNVGADFHPLVINLSNQIGVGTYSPTATLHTSGSLRFEGFTGSGFLQIDVLGNVSVYTGALSAAAPGNTQFESRLVDISESVIEQSIVFTQPFGFVPIVVGNLIYTGTNFIVPNIRDISSTGFNLGFSDVVNASGYQYNFIALSGNIYSISGNGGGDATIPTNILLTNIGVSIDAGLDTIETGYKGYFEVASDILLSGWNIVASSSGYLLMDINRASYDSFPVFTSLVTGIPPSLNNQNKSFGNTMTGWNVNVSRGDILEFFVRGCTGITKVNINITGAKG